MPYQNINAQLKDGEKQQILDLLTQIKTLLPFLVNLTTEERSTLYKMGDKSIGFVEKALEYSKNNPNLVAPYTNIPELEADFSLAKQLAPIVQQIASLSESLDDTFMAAGSEAIIAATSFYNTVKNAEKSNVPGVNAIYEDLKARFSKPSKKPAP